MKIIKRWQELEGAEKPSPKTRLELAKEQVVLIEIIEKKEAEILHLEYESETNLQIANEATIQINQNREWASVKYVEAKFHVKIDWRIIKRWNEHLGKDTKHIEDQNYGKVRTYHKDAWLEAYDVDINL